MHRGMWSMLRSLFAPSTRKPERTTRLQFESLETRDVPATVSLNSGVLTVLGTNDSELISVSQSGSTISALGRSFAAGSVSRITVSLGGGNDQVAVSMLITKPCALYGGSGNDILYGGGGHDSLYGGSGIDQLYGRTGNDVIFGGTGTDTISDAVGSNTLVQESPSRARSTTLQTTLEREIVRLVNLERTSRGLTALTVNATLFNAAHFHATNMAARSNTFVDPFDAMQHTLTGTIMPTMTDRMDYVGYNFRSVRENIAAGYTTAASVVAAWMVSPGHRANILATDVTEFGVRAVANAAGVLFYAQNFGARL